MTKEAPRPFHWKVANLRIGTASRMLLASSLFAMIARYSSVIAAFLFNAILARQLTQSEYGTFLLMVGVVMMCELLFTCGLGEYAVRVIPGFRANGDAAGVSKLLQQVLLIGSCATVVALAIGWSGWCGSWLAAITQDPRVADAFPWAMILLIAWASNGLAGQVLLGLGFGRLSPLLYYLVPKIVSLTAVWLCIDGWMQLDTTRSLHLMTLGYVCSLAFGLWLIRRSIAGKQADGTATGLRSVLAVSLPLMASRLLQVTTPAVTLWIIAIHASSDDVARFGATHRLLEGLTTAFAVITFVFRPTISLMVEQGRLAELSAMCRSLATLILLPNLLLVVAAVTFGGSMTAFVYGDPYRNAGILLAIMSVGYCIQAAMGPAIEVLRLSGHHAITLRLQIVMTAILFAAQVFALRWFSVVAVAILLSLHYAAISIVFAVLASRLQKTRTICTLSPRTLAQALTID